MRRTKTNINTTNPFVTTYGYKDISLDKTTTLLNSISYSNGKGFVYTYDANGNILTIKDQNNTLLAGYTYDSLNQLTREDNAQLNKTITYTYDNGGNILSIKEHAFTTGELGSVTNEKTYTYGNSEWKDLLTNYNGTSITYDTIGNPLNWINGEQFTWSGGRRLTNVVKGTTNISYTYNNDNIRTSKIVNGVKTDFYLNGTTIIMQKTGDNVIWYTYDENELVSGFRYNGMEYYYFRNAQNDIIGIIDASGAVVANYTYDSWGNHITITDGNNNDVSGNSSHIANVNPFRYRSYYFDTETGLYYLNSRYYDANVGRFLNADSLIDNRGTTAQNLFAYCGNNPIVRIDPSGKFWWWWIVPVIFPFIMSGCSNNSSSPLPTITPTKPATTATPSPTPSPTPSSKPKTALTEDQKVFVATIAAEGTVTVKGNPVSSQGRKAMANVIMNRVGKREWSKYKTVADICANTGFDGYGDANYNACMAYLNKRDGSNKTYEKIIAEVIPIYNGEVADITGGCQLYFTPAAMRPPGRMPNWNFDVIEEVEISGVDTYYEGRFYRYK